MPEAIAGALATEIFATGVTIGTALTYTQAAIAVYGLYQSNRARSAASASQSFQGQSVTVRASDAARWQVYGRAIPTPGLLYAVVHPANPAYLTLVLDVAHHEIDAFEDFYLNGDSIGNLGSGTWDGAASSDVVQPGSKWYKNDVQMIPEALVWPASAGTVTLAHTPDHIDSVSYVSDTAGTVITTLIEGFDYSLSGATLTALNSTHAGKSLVVTYRANLGYPLLRVRRFLGTPAGQRDTILEADSGGEWNAQDVLCGVATMRITIRWDANTFGSIGLPEFRALIRGKKVKNWATSAVAWSNNAALCQADYFTDTQFGFGVAAADMNSATVIAAQNACDEAVHVDAVFTQVRYQLDGVVSSEATLFDNLRTMLGASVGAAVWSAGQWRLFAGAYQIPSLTLDDTHYAEGEKVASPFTTTRDSFNSIRGRYTNLNIVGQPDDWPAYVSSTYVAQDGGEPIYKEIDLPFTTNPLRAQRIAKQLLYKVRQSYTWSASYNLAAYPLQPLDGCYLKHKRRGWDTLNGGLGKSFAVRTRKFNPNGKIELTFVEDVAALYAWDYSEQTDPDPSPNVALPDPSKVDPLGNFHVTTSAVTFRKLTDGTVIPYAKLTWDRITDPSVRDVIIEYKRDFESKFSRMTARPDDTEFHLEPVSGGEVLQIQAYNKSSIGTTSKYAIVTHVCSTDLPSLNSQSATANWLTNSLFAFGTVGWSLFRNGADAGTNFFKPALADQWLGGSYSATPSNAVLYNPAPFPIGGNAPQLFSNPAPVSVGQGVGAMMSLLPIQCNASIGLLFLNENSAATGYYVSDAVTDHYLGGLSDPRKRESYDTARVWAEAPAGSVAVRLFLTMVGPLRGTTACSVFVTEPLMGPCEQSGLANLKWTPGGQSSIGTALMEVNATNVMYRPAVAIPNAVTTTTSEVADILMRFTPSESGQIEITYECECASQNINGEYTLTAGFSITGVNESIGAPSIVSAAVLTTGASANDLAAKAMTRKATFTAVAGREIIISHYMLRAITAEYASAKLGIAYTPTTGKRFNGRDSFSDRRLSALLMPNTTALLATT